jgi:hypothetical protein
VNCFDLLGCEGYWHDVGQVFRGYGDAAVGTAKGIGFVACHPIQAVQGIGTAVVHYEDTYNAIKDEVIEKSGTCRGQGELLGTVLITVATSGGAGAGAKATGMAGKIAQSTARAAKALKAGVIGEDVTNAARVAKVITKAEATAGATSKVGAGAAKAPGSAAVGEAAEAGAINLMKQSDRFIINAAKRADVDPSGFMDIIAHGGGKSIKIVLKNGREVTISHRAFVRYLKANPAYQGQNIRLLSCRTGKLKHGFAQGLADRLGVTVRAPDDILWAHPDGKLTIGPDAFTESGSFIDFVPYK